MLSSIVKKADNPIFIFEKNGTIKWANNAYKQLHGKNSSEKNAETNDNFEFLNILNDTDRNFFLQNKSLSFSRKIITEKGEYLWIQSTMTPIKDGGNNLTDRYIVIETDITHQKEVEEELVQRWENTQTLTEHLETVKDYVEEQIDDLTEQKRILQEAKDKSEEVLNKVLPYEVAIQLKKKG